MTTPLDYALYYASRNWAVFPLKPKDKKPLPGSNGFLDAVTDPAKIRQWWGENQEYNIGIATGQTSGFIVIDLDFGHGGEESIAALIAKHGELPATITARTGGGGRHLLYKMPALDLRNTAGKLGKGIDTRANGGYIAAPPSLHPTGARYQWIDLPSKAELAELPGWMLEALMKQDEPKAVTSNPQDGAIETGSRNAVLTSLAGTMRRRGMGESAIIAALMQENQTKCIPPLSAAEVTLIAKSVCRYDPSAAPIMQSRERLGIEWAFCKSIFDTPFNVDEFTHVSPDLFQDDNLRMFWTLVLGGYQVTRAAAEAGILVELEKAEANPNNLDVYADRLKKLGYAASIQRAAQDLAAIARTGDMDKIQTAIDALAANKQAAPVVAVDAAEGLESLEKSLREGRQFIKTKIPNLDNVLGGLERQKLSILAARPSVGKTTLAWQIARNVAASGNRVLFLSLEVSAISLWRKAAFGIAEITQAQIENGTINPAKMEEVYSEIIPDLKQIYTGKLYIHDQPPYSTSALGRVSAQVAPDLVVIDHLGYVDEKADKLVEKLGKITKWGKNLSKMLNAHVMIISQLNRGVEARENKEPVLSDLRDSGNIEEDADVVIMPYRKNYHDLVISQRFSETFVFIRKNRDGALGAPVLFMDMLQQWFYRLEELPPNWKNARLD